MVHWTIDHVDILPSMVYLLNALCHHQVPIKSLQSVVHWHWVSMVVYWGWCTWNHRHASWMVVVGARGWPWALMEVDMWLLSLIPMFYCLKPMPPLTGGPSPIEIFRIPVLWTVQKGLLSICPWQTLWWVSGLEVDFSYRSWKFLNNNESTRHTRKVP